MDIRRLNAADAPGKVKRAALSMLSQRECQSLRYIPHALKASMDDRYGNLAQHLPRHLDVNSPDISFVEVEMNAAGCVEKVVARLRTALRYRGEAVDLVLVVLRDGTVKTVWGNVASDNHATLRLSRLH